jgi:hypothetical protein
LEDDAFIAAYAGGNTSGRTVDLRGHSTGELSNDPGTVLAVVSSVIFGADILGPQLTVFEVTTVACALLSLTAVSSMPVSGRRRRPTSAGSDLAGARPSSSPACSSRTPE